MTTPDLLHLFNQFSFKKNIGTYIYREQKKTIQIHVIYNSYRQLSTVQYTDIFLFKVAGITGIYGEYIPGIYTMYLISNLGYMIYKENLKQV